jgi:hypothetical protein
VADVWLLWWLGPVLLEHVALSGSVSLSGRVYWRQCSTDSFQGGMLRSPMLRTATVLQAQGFIPAGLL